MSEKDIYKLAAVCECDECPNMITHNEVGWPTCRLTKDEIVEPYSLPDWCPLPDGTPLFCDN